MTKIQWGVMSAANIAYDELVPALRRSKHGHLAAVASKNLKKAERFHAPLVYNAYEQLLDDKSINAVYIPLPNSLHAKWAIRSLQKGKHVLLEKPAALTAEEMKAIKIAAQENDVVFMEAFMYQFHC